MEPGRAPAVQPDQQELGGGAAPDARDHAGYIRGTTTRTGLRVTAELDEGTYQKGQRVRRDDLEKISLKPHAVCPSRIYTISPIDAE